MKAILCSSRLLSIFFIILAVSLPAGAIPVQGHRILYSGPSALAIPAMKRVTEQGGNVVDSAIAVLLALSVTSPYYAALGGGGFALIKMKGEVDALDFRETAPASAGRDYFKDVPPEASITGGRAVGVPGVPAGLWALHQKYGKLSWTQLFETALALAENGFAVSGEWVEETQSEKGRFNAAGEKTFFKKGGVSYRPGEILKQPKLAVALREFRNRNVRAFYSGPIAQDIVRTVQEGKGTMTLEDLRAYKVRWLKPMVTEFEGHKIYMMPPPSSGGVVLTTALALMEKLKLKEKGLLSVDELHLLAEIQKRAYRGRALLGDPDFTQNPVGMLTSAEYIEEMAKSIHPRKSRDLKPLAEAKQEKPETTHFSIMDASGNAIALTLTLNGGYGSGLVTSKYGIALNNEMDDFTTKPGTPNMYGLIQGEANAVQGGKRPLSSMSPTLVEKNGEIVMSLGSPGGPRIISGVLQVLYRVLAQNMDIDLAIQTPRVHHQFLPNKLFLEPKRLSPEVLQSLRDRKHVVEESWMGKVYVVHRRADGLLEAAFDSRGEGAAGGI